MFDWRLYKKAAMMMTARENLARARVALTLVRAMLMMAWEIWQGKGRNDDDDGKCKSSKGDNDDDDGDGNDGNDDNCYSDGNNDVKVMR
jgi:hypothetical protein